MMQSSACLPVGLVYLSSSPGIHRIVFPGHFISGRQKDHWCVFIVLIFNGFSLFGNFLQVVSDLGFCSKMIAFIYASQRDGPLAFSQSECARFSYVATRSRGIQSVLYCVLSNGYVFTF